ncbi:MAG TPA: heme exporter protein CcmD [Stellaceae bacterium]
MAGIAHYLEMGGYAVFVWPAFGVAVVIMAGLAIQSLTKYRRCRRELARLERDGA